MNETLIRKYAPKKWEDFHFHGNITNIFQMYIDVNKIKLLISGTHGTGKTTLLNVIKHQYFGDCSEQRIINENILYVNPLKEQGIQYYRNDVKIFCQTYCTIKGKKKFVIMDDFDLVNEQSQQVFRSIVDTYENNVHFLITTSDVFKIVESIQSRFTIIKLPVFTSENIENLCKTITTNESIHFKDDTMKLFLSICDNNIQIMLQYLEGFRLLNTEVNNDTIYQMCSHVNFDRLGCYFSFLKENNLIEAIRLLFDIHNDGFSVMDILDSIFDYVKIHDHIANEETKYKLIKYICKYITIFHEIHEEEIELAMFSNNIIKLFNE
uniref:AAA domain-containing protein n=1 Tax=viral metagenome TaxID=1070528 RepID=A0A6C0LTH1_9ZZZZ|tara:strand:- start:2849 stop:3817 length:969 start_codon:yes stop_codon:yes gene_type:complete